MEIRGTIKKIGDIQTFGANGGFQKREFIFVTEETFPQTLSLEISGSKIDILDPWKEGSVAVVGINIQGREWTSPTGETKYFNTLSAWKIVKPQ